MGTTDLKRSLIGTLLNGFSQENIDPKLKPIIEKFQNGRVQDEKVTLEGPILDQQEQKALQS
jgi:hypothetical protein